MTYIIQRLILQAQAQAQAKAQAQAQAQAKARRVADGPQQNIGDPGTHVPSW